MFHFGHLGRCTQVLIILLFLIFCIYKIFPSLRIDHFLGFPGGLDGKEVACNAEDLGLISRSGRFPGEGNGNPLQHYCLEHPMDRGDSQATVHRDTKNQTRLK